MDAITRELAFQLLIDETEKVYTLIDSQKQHLCFAACPAFEEVVDTQLYGLSKQIDYAVKLGVLDQNAGMKILSDLEYSLNNMYTNYYEQNKNHPQFKGE
ncbi:DUF1507 family protein [Jeotgalibaca sp. A127]|uniref:DUF1507 family protein n=1 Tax=Jeotgalibaca sp. A127 TaxID=3457324 RepID=UPI003FD1CCA6